MHDRLPAVHQRSERFCCPTALALWLNKTLSGIIGPEPLPRVSHSEKMLSTKNKGPFWPQLFPPRPGREQRADDWKVTLWDNNHWKELLTQYRQELSNPWASSQERPHNSKGFKGVGSLHSGQFQPWHFLILSIGKLPASYPNLPHWQES